MSSRLLLHAGLHWLLGFFWPSPRLALVRRQPQVRPPRCGVSAQGQVCLWFLRECMATKLDGRD